MRTLVQNEASRVNVLRGLAQYLPESLMAKALEVARSLQNEASRAEALWGLTRYLPESLMAEALEAARSIQDEKHRDSALSGLLPQLKTLETDIALWHEVLHTLAYQDRKQFVAHIPKLSPAILSLSGGDQQALKKMVQAMIDVCRQWP